MMALLSIDNVEEEIEKAIKKYWAENMLADAMFWKMAIELLKEKLKK